MTQSRLIWAVAPWLLAVGASGTPLHTAAIRGDATEVRRLLDAGTDPNARRESGSSRNTSLHEAAMRGHADAVKALLDGGADPKARGSAGKTALHWAAERGHAEIVGALVAAGADLNATNNRQRAAPLHGAAKRGHAEIVGALLSSGADPRARDKDGQTPLDIAAAEGHTAILATLREAAGNDGTENLASGFLCSFNPQSAAPRNFSSVPPCPSTGWGSYFSGDMRDRLSELIERTGLRKDRFVATGDPGNIARDKWERNAVAYTCQDSDGTIKKAIMWDSAFMREMDDRAGTSWASVAILGHEIAHHINSDTVQTTMSGRKSREQELYADRWAGYTLAQLEVEEEDAVAVFGHLGPGGDTHPPSTERVEWASEGWSEGAANRPDPSPRRTETDYTPEREGGDTRRTRYPSPTPPPSPRYATMCVTQIGSCALGMPIIAGNACYCPTFYGPAWGIAQ